jgi:SH3-like domain-containing protein
MFRLKSLPGLVVSLSLLVFAQASQAKDMVSVNRAEANMRSGASSKYSVLWELGKGYPLEVTSRKGNWLKVRDFENDTGWVYRPSVAKKPHVIVKAGVVNVRSAPSTSSRILGKAERGEVLRTVEHRNQWVKVQRESGVKGWISRGLVWGW